MSRVREGVLLMSSLEYMRGEKNIKRSKPRGMSYESLSDLKEGSHINSKTSKRHWREFKEGLANEN